VIRATLKSLRAHVGQLLLTLLSIALGVSFVVGTLIYTATTSQAFEGLFADAFAGIDINVQPVFDPELVFNPGDVARLDDGSLSSLESTPGVDRAWGLVESVAQLSTVDGELLSPSGPPPLAFNWPGDDLPIALQIVEGRSPSTDDEVAVDETSFETGELSFGDTVAVFAVGGRAEFTVVGVTNFGGLPALAGSNVSLTTAAAQKLFDAEGQYTRLSATIDEGADLEEVLREARLRLGDEVDVISGQTAAEQGAQEITDALGFLNTFLLIFAGVSVFVGIFIIYNTFRILISRRTRELSLMRAIGATSRQVTRATLVESLVVGLIASAIGVVFGIGLAIGLRALLERIGVDLPSTSLVVEPSVIVIGLVLGMVVTVGSALLPILRVRRITPMEGLRDIGGPPGRRPLLKRVAWSVLLLVVGSALAVLGVIQPNVWMVGIGAVTGLLGVIALSPALVPPVIRFLGVPFVAGSKSTGMLAQRNAIRSPRRSAATAAAALVCVALLTLASVFVASLLGVIDEALESGSLADLVVTPEGFTGGSQGFSPAVGDSIEALEETEIVGRQRFGQARVDGDVMFVGAVSDREFDLVSLDRQEGVLTDLADQRFVTDFATADEKGWSIGDLVPFDFLLGSTELKLAGKFEGTALSGVIVGTGAFEAFVPNSLDIQVDIKLAEGVDVEEGRAAINAVVDEYPGLTVSDQSEVRERLREQTLSALGLIFGLLGLAVGVAFIGLANTTVLSTIERTREIGLLRAVGLERKDLRRMIYFESTMIAAFGAVLGVVSGIGLARALLKALEDEGFTVFIIPWAGLLALVLFISVLGFAAAGIPAWRAARGNILEAIAYE